jgi:short-subunit dehydrogenase
MSDQNGLAIITGASTGIGLELARCCAERGFRLLIAADEPAIAEAAAELRSAGAEVETVQADLATETGVDKLHAARKGSLLARFSPTPESGLAVRFSIRTTRGRGV